MVRKTYSDCYLYNKYPIYNKIIFEAMMDKNFIDKGVDSFKDVVYEIKRTRTNDHILSVLTSPKTVLLSPASTVPVNKFMFQKQIISSFFHSSRLSFSILYSL